jgi:drug/metabolite transporter (DMT)-like permease
LSRPARPGPSSSDSVHHRALPALLLGGIAIGCSPILVRISEIGPIATAFWRLTLALLPLLIINRRSVADPLAHRTPARARDYFEVAAPGLFLAGDLAAWHISLHMTSVANSTLLVNVAPIFVTLFSWLALKQRIRRLFVVGLTVAIVGIVVLKGGPHAMGGGHSRGDCIAVFAAALYAGYILLLGRARSIYSTSTIMLWTTISAALCTGAMAWLSEPALLPATAAGWLILIGLAWISQAGGQGLIAFALAWLPATMTSLTLLIQPVVAALLAWALLREPLSGFQIVGGLTVIAGIALARRGS